MEIWGVKEEKETPSLNYTKGERSSTPFSFSILFHGGGKRRGKDVQIRQNSCARVADSFGEELSDPCGLGIGGLELAIFAKELLDEAEGMLETHWGTRPDRKIEQSAKLKDEYKNKTEKLPEGVIMEGNWGSERKSDTNEIKKRARIKQKRWPQNGETTKNKGSN